MAKKVCYVVLKGRKPGIYKTWDECKAQTDKYPGADYHGCSSYEEANEIFAKAYGSKVTVVEDKKTEAIDVLQDVTVDMAQQISYPMYTRTVKGDTATNWKIEQSVF